MNDSDFAQQLGIKPCQWENMFPEDSPYWRCITHDYGAEDPLPKICGCAQDQLCSGRAGVELVRTILTDLIEKVHGSAFGHTPVASLGNYVCNSCDEVWPCHTEKAIDGAEARMRALQTPGDSAGADLKKGEGSGDE